VGAAARANKLILAGDHCQLRLLCCHPKPLNAARCQLDGTAHRALRAKLFSLAHCATPDELRDHGFSNAEFYNGELIAHDSVANHRLCDLPGVEANPLTETPVQFIDTRARVTTRNLRKTRQSRNVQEAALAVKKVCALLDAGVNAAQIGVITPYRAQVRLLRERLGHVPELEIDSVDGFQGREKSDHRLVRAVNNEGEIGFLADTRRTNVALIRARRSCC